MNRLTSCLVVLAATVALASCKSDPQATAREHFEKGNQQLERKAYPEAIIEYRRAIQSDPRLGQARLQLASAYAATGDGINALREYVRAADLLPDDHDAQRKAGTFMLLAGQYQDAQGLAQRMLQRNPNDAQAHILLANALAGMKDTEGAIAMFEKAVTLDPKRAGTYTELGSAQLASGDREAAEKAFRKAIEIDPKSATARMAFANFMWATGKLPEAEQEMRAALELDPNHLVTHRALAMFLMLSRRPAEAEPHLKAVADASPGPQAKYFLAEYYVRLNRIDEARDLLTPLMQDDDAFVGASVRLARIEALAQKPADAHRLLDAALAREPKNVEALVTRARLFLAENNTINALTALQTAVAADPRSVEGQIALGDAYSVRGQLKEAATAYNDALKVDAGNLDGRMGLARVQINTGNAAEAVPLILKVVEERPTNGEARLLLLHGLIAAGDFSQASYQLQVLTKTNPNSAAVLNAAGMLATAREDTEAARLAYARALEAEPRSYQALAGLLNAEMQGKQFGRARALIEKKLAEMPNDPNTLLMAAQTYSALGDAFEMEQALKKTVEADPASLQAYTMLGKMYYQQGRLDLARRELEKYVSTAPLSVPGNTMLGTILELQGRKDEAKTRYGKALQIDPRAAVAANNLAWINANSGGNLDMALQLAQTAKSQLPNRHEIDDTLGWIYYKKGLSSMAIESLSASTQRQPDNPSYNYHLALAHHQNGNKEEARKLLEKALKSKSTFDGADEAKKLLESLSAGTNDR
jgi:tetratricopeptide (TPR) repeat protein